MEYPRININLSKIKFNTEAMVRQCHQLNIEVAGVTKLFCGNPQIAEVYIDSGVDLLADSRIENLMKMKDLPLPKMLLRLPMMSQVSDIIAYSDIGLVSEPVTVQALSDEAQRYGKVYKVILMIDLGDLREGIFHEEEIRQAVDEIIKMKSISLEGIGTNLTCYGGVKPTWENLIRLKNWKECIEKQTGQPLRVISGGNGSTLSLLPAPGIPAHINQLRLGSSLTMGIGLNDEPIKGLYQDAFTLEAEIVEIREKPSKPVGEIGLDAFGNQPVFEDKGFRRRAICAIGRQDIHPEHLSPVEHGIIILGASSDHLLLDITETTEDSKVGDMLTFYLTYGGCLSALTSPYVQKYYV